MYTIYIGNSKKHRLCSAVKKSNINYNNNIIYNKPGSSINDIREVIKESQFIIVDVTEPCIISGLVIGIASECGTRMILVNNGDVQLEGDYELVKYSDESYEEVSGLIEKILTN